MRFKEVDIKSLKINPFVMLEDQWGLLSVGDAEKFNAMTIAWGGFGVMWSKPVISVVIRPQKYTFEFMEKFDLFTVSFYPEEYRKALQLLGTKSGRDSNKIKESGLTPFHIDGTVAFEEAQSIYLCRKIFGGQQLDAFKFTDPGLDFAMYPNMDYHYVYVGEITKVLTCSMPNIP